MYLIIQTLSENWHFTVLFAVNKRSTQIISDGSLIVNLYVWHVWIHWDCKTPSVAGVSKRSKNRFNPNWVVKECTACASVFSFFFFFFFQHGLHFVGPRFDKLIPKLYRSWSDVAYNSVWSGSYCFSFFFFFCGCNTASIIQGRFHSKNK